MDVEEAKAIIWVPEPYSLVELKAQFRKASMFMHPDCGGSDDKFVRLTEAFDVLKEKACNVSCFNIGGEPVTIDGVLLKDLGKGYPLSEPAKTCDMCLGKGYKSFKGEIEKKEECKVCAGTGIFFVPCKKCGGDGKYKNLKTKQVIGDCNLCGGTGRFYPPFRPHMPSKTTRFNRLFSMMNDFRAKYVTLKNGNRVQVNHCRECGGNGYRNQIIEVERDGVFLKCDQCKGVGEIKMWNPVIPRGFMKGAVG